MRKFLVYIFLFLSLSSFPGYGEPSADFGKEVRITGLDGGQLTGIFISISTDTDSTRLIMKRDGQESHVIPLGSITVIEVRNPSTGIWEETSLDSAIKTESTLLYRATSKRTPEGESSEAVAEDLVSDAPKAGYWESVWFHKIQEKPASQDPTQEQYLRAVSEYDWDATIRSELISSGDEYLRLLLSANGLWNSPETEDYLTQAILKVWPASEIPGGWGNIRIRVVEQTYPQAIVFPHGSIIVTTGLICSLRSEDELLAILAHETAHIVRDHTLKNYRAIADRKAIGTFFVNLAALGTAVAVGQTGASTQEALMAGLGVGIVGHYVTSDLIELLGAKYSRGQELEADRLAQGWLESTGRVESGLANALVSLMQSPNTKGSSGLSPYDTHPGLYERIQRLQVEYETSRTSLAYDRRIAACLVHVAELEVGAGRYSYAAKLLDRAIAAEWVSSKAYLLRAIAMRHTENSDGSNEECLNLLEEAARDTLSMPWIAGERGLIELRMGNLPAAETAFTQLLANSRALPKQREWARGMVQKVRRNRQSIRLTE